MRLQHVSALPVVDKSGLIVGSISNRDIHVTCKSAAMSDTLHKTVRQFIEVAHQERDEMVRSWWRVGAIMLAGAHF